MRRPKETGVGEIRTYDVIPDMPDAPMDFEGLKKTFDDVYENPWQVIDISSRNAPELESEHEWPQYAPSVANTSPTVEHTVESPSEGGYLSAVYRVLKRWRVSGFRLRS